MTTKIAVGTKYEDVYKFGLRYEKEIKRHIEKQQVHCEVYCCIDPVKNRVDRIYVDVFDRVFEDGVWKNNKVYAPDFKQFLKAHLTPKKILIKREGSGTNFILFVDIDPNQSY